MFILHLYVGVIALDFKISRKVFDILFSVYYVITIVEIFLLPIKRSDFKTVILSEFVVACLSSGAFIYIKIARYNKGTWTQKKSFYYIDGKKFYIHKIVGDDVICSYNRLFDEKKDIKLRNWKMLKHMQYSRMM